MMDPNDGFDDAMHLFRDDDDLLDDENVNFDDFAMKIELEEQRLLVQLTTSEQQAVEPPPSPVMPSRHLKPGQEVSEQAAAQPSPQYLIGRDNAFENKMLDLILTTGARVDMNELRHYALQLHQLRVTELNRTLWRTYSQSGEGTLLNEHEKRAITSSTRQLKLWPDEVKTTMIEYHRTTRPMNLIDDSTCFNYVYQVVHRLDERVGQYRTDLDEHELRLDPHLTPVIKETIRRFIDEIGIFRYRAQVDAKLVRVKHNYYQRLLELDFDDQHPQPSQFQLWKELMRLKYEREKLVYDIRTLKHRLSYNQPPRSYDTIQLPLPMEISAINDFFLGRRLRDRCEKIVQRAKSDTVLIHIQMWEYQLKERTQQLEEHLQVMEGLPVVHLSYQQLTATMIEIVQRRFVHIEECVQQLYDLKKRFFYKAPMVRN